MNNKLALSLIFFVFIVSLRSSAQSCNGTLYTIASNNFGTGTTEFGPPLPAGATGYTYINGGPGSVCTNGFWGGSDLYYNNVQDGRYTLVKHPYSALSSCTQPFLAAGYVTSPWINAPDHSGNNGYALLCNAAGTPDIFYTETYNNLCAGTVCAFSIWAANICKASLNNINPKVKIELVDPVTLLVISSTSSPLLISTSDNSLNWQEIVMNFTVPAGLNSVKMVVRNEQSGNGGNDLVLDDVSFRVCIPAGIITSISSVPQSNNYCRRDTLSFTVPAGTFANPFIQWQDSFSGGTWTDIAGANAPIFVTPQLTAPAPKFYRVKYAGDLANLNNTNCRGLSEVYQVAVNAPAIVANVNSPVCQNDSIHLTVTPIPGASYSWSHNGNAVPFSFNQNPSFPSNPGSAGSYTVKVNIGSCQMPPVPSVNVTVNPYKFGLRNVIICPGQSYTFNGITYTTANNTAKDTIPNATGCDSIITLNLTLSPYLTGTTVKNICPGQSYTFNGITYTTANSTAKDTLQTAGGCDSIVTLNLTVSPYLTGTDFKNICQGQSYTFNGITYTTANNTAKDTLQTAAGCDSIVTLNLTVSPYLTGTAVKNICPGQSYTFNGITYTTANSTAKDTLQTAAGCDSIVTLNLTVSPYLTGIAVKNICQGQSYTFNGITYNTANSTAKDTLQTAGGCDSIVTLNLTVSPYLTGTDFKNICQGQGYTFNGITYTMANSTAKDTLQTAGGCDSIVTLNLTVSPYLTGTAVINICPGQSYAFNGITYTTANSTAKDTLQTAGGCDSIVTLNLTVSPYLTGTAVINICPGQSYTFNGITYTMANNTAKDTFQTLSGCDSIVTLDLTVSPAITHTLNAQICQGQSYTFNGVTYTTTQSGITGSFSTAAGCDSMVTFNLMVSPYLTGTDFKNICQGQSYTFNGITYTTANNTAKDTFQTLSGCDSIVTLDLTVSPAITHTLNAQICQGQSYTFNGVTYATTQSGITGSFSTAAGCDSMVTFNLMVSPYLTGTDVKNICPGQSYTFNGVIYTTANNTAKDTFQTLSGCDSIVTLDLTVSPAITHTLNALICQGQGYTFNGVTYTTTQSGITGSFSTAAGCDSMVTFNLMVSPYLTGTDVKNICPSQSYTFNGITYTTANSTAKDTLQTAAGCDSIVTLNLTVSPYLTGIAVKNICPGQGYTFNGITYTTANNTAKDTLQTAGGCDSIVTLNLTVSPYLTGTTVINICPGQSYTFNGITYTTANNTAKDTLQTAGGCDSIVTLSLTVSPYLTGTDVQNICQGQSYTFNGITYTTANNTAKDTFQTLSGCDSIVTLDLTVSPSITHTLNAQICQGQDYTFNGVTYTTTQSGITGSFSTTAGCDSMVTLNLMVSPYLTGTDVQNICPGQSYTFNGITYTTANNTAKDTFQTLSGCDSIVTLDLTVSPAITHTLNAQICQGQSYTFNGVTYATTQSGITGSFSTAAGCDSMVTFNLMVSPYLTGTDVKNICPGQSYTFNGVIYTTANNTAKDTFQTLSGCDSIVTLDLTVSPAITHTLNALICQGQSYTFNGVTYTTTQSGITGSFSTAAGCDSIVTLNLTVSPYLTGTAVINICQGQGYTFNGITYTTANNTAKDTFQTLSGCDSIVTLDLTVSPAITHTLNAQICQGQGYTFNSVTYTTTQSGITGSFSTAAGCDSIVTFNLMVSPYLTGTDVQNICQGQSYTFNGITYTTANNTAKDTFQTLSGCDSIVTLDLTVSPAITHTLNAQICQGQGYTFNGVTYTTTQSGITGTFSTAAGCDSIVTLNLTVSPYLTGTAVVNICPGQAYTFNGITYTTANNTAKDTFQTLSGCDSIVTLNLTISPYLTGIAVKNICQGQSYTFNGVTYTTANNTAKDTLQTAAGCDSIVTLNLTVDPYLTGTDIKNICQGQGYTFNGITYTTANNMAKDTLQTAGGCDSIVSLNLSINPLPVISIRVVPESNRTFCIGDSVHLEAAGASEYSWENGRGVLLGGGEGINNLLPESMNKFKVTGTDDHNCINTADIVIHAEPCCLLQMPNAFSPNGDGLNDKFGPVTNGHPLNYRLQIFNRWGQLVFVSYKINDRWDGTMGGNRVDIGTYFYNVNGNCVNNEPISIRGDITLIR